MTDVLLVGPVPPPLGGVATHVERLAAALDEQGLDIGVLNHYGRESGPHVVGALRRNPIRYWSRLRSARARIVHLHYGGGFPFLLAAALATRARRDETHVVTVHGHVVRPGGRLTRWALRRFDVVVAVSPDVARELRGVEGPEMLEISPYIAPAREVAERAGSAPTLVVAASRITMHGEHDTYGLDFAAELFVELARERPDLRLSIFLAKPPRKRAARTYLHGVMEGLRRLGFGERATLHLEEDLLPALERPAVLLRPTLTDGDSMTIKEALDAGVPVLASDVVARPAGVATLPLRDLPAWREAAATALDASAAGSPGYPGLTRPSGWDELLALYERFVPARAETAPPAGVGISR